MIVLAIDSAMNGCSAALCDAEKGLVLAHEDVHVMRGQAELLVPMVNGVMDKSGYSYKSVDVVAVTKGPGAFTGMRIAMATAKSLGLALSIPVIGVCTFQAVLESYTGNIDSYDYIAVVLETKRQDFYVQIFNAKTKHACSDKMALTAEEFKGILDLKKGRYLILGDAFDRLNKEGDIPESVTSEILQMPQSPMIAFIAAKMYKEMESDDYCCTPVYIRPPDVSMPKRVQRPLV